jgi:hypothetical protein
VRTFGAIGQVQDRRHVVNDMSTETEDIVGVRNQATASEDKLGRVIVCCSEKSIA